MEKKKEFATEVGRLSAWAASSLDTLAFAPEIEPELNHLYELVKKFEVCQKDFEKAEKLFDVMYLYRPLIETLEHFSKVELKTPSEYLVELENWAGKLRDFEKATQKELIELTEFFLYLNCKCSESQRTLRFYDSLRRL